MDCIGDDNKMVTLKLHKRMAVLHTQIFNGMLNDYEKENMDWIEARYATDHYHLKDLLEKSYFPQDVIDNFQFDYEFNLGRLWDKKQEILKKPPKTKPDDAL